MAGVEQLSDQVGLFNNSRGSPFRGARCRLSAASYAKSPANSLLAQRRRINRRSGRPWWSSDSHEQKKTEAPTRRALAQEYEIADLSVMVSMSRSSVGGTN
jgi:hypothetical protein